MKAILPILFYFISIGLFAQNFDKIGIDARPVLNEDEVELLNTLLKDERDGFNFAEKKVAFITGPSGKSVFSKSDYFNHSVIPWLNKDAQPQISMLELTELEKSKSGGYEVLVLSWVKVFTNKRRERIINELGEKH